MKHSHHVHPYLHVLSPTKKRTAQLTSCSEEKPTVELIHANIAIVCHTAS